MYTLGFQPLIYSAGHPEPPSSFTQGFTLQKQTGQQHLITYLTKYYSSFSKGIGNQGWLYLFGDQILVLKRDQRSVAWISNARQNPLCI